MTEKEIYNICDECNVDSKEFIKRIDEGIFKLALHYGMIVRDDVLNSDIAEEDRKTLEMAMKYFKNKV